MTDRSFGLFEPDALLPAQFYAAFRGGSGVRGEKRLMLAVLEDALDCFQKYAAARDGHGQTLFEEANTWITSNARIDWRTRMARHFRLNSSNTLRVSRRFRLASWSGKMP